MHVPVRPLLLGGLFHAHHLDVEAHALIRRGGGVLTEAGADHDDLHANNPVNPARPALRVMYASGYAPHISAPQEAPNGPGYWYFPFGERGLGHAVSDRAPDGTEIGFKAFYDRYGGENTFGYPMEPPARRTGADGVERWTQRFQAALFEHHAEYDIDGAQPESGLPWRTWRVQLRLLGDEYLRDERLPFVSGDPAQHLARPPQPTP